MLIIGPMAYVAEQTRDAEMMDIVARAYAAVARESGSGWGKSFAMQLHFVSDVLGALDRADENREAVDLALHLDPERLRREAMLHAPYATRLLVRAPTDKVIHLLREGEGAFKIDATRTPHGARPREEDTGTIQVLAPGGEVVQQAEFDTDGEWSWSPELPAGGPKGVYSVRIHDDQRAVWDVNSSEGKRVVELVKDLAFGSIGTGRWVLYVPAGVTEFTLTVVDWHRGRFGALVLAPDASVLAEDDVQQPREGGGRQAVMPIKLAQNPDGVLLDVVLFTGTDLKVQVEGIPPYIAPSPEAWFNPQEH